VFKLKTHGYKPSVTDDSKANKRYTQKRSAISVNTDFMIMVQLVVIMMLVIILFMTVMLGVMVM
jgi:hypothetical protein